MSVGRKAGTPKTGGRKRGTRNKVTKARQAAVEASGLAPLDYLLTVMRDVKMPLELRIDAAKSVAPYLYHRLASVQHTGADGGAMKFEQIVRIIVDPKETRHGKGK